MAEKWTAQEPAREEWDGTHGTRFVVDVLNERGHLVCVTYGENAIVAMRRALRVERRAA